MSPSDSSWSGADAYAASFARLCDGSIDGLLGALPSGTTLLDVGTGTVLARALERGWDAAGVEPSPEMLRLAAMVVPPERLHRGELSTLPFDDARFDAVVADFVINHLPDPRAGIRDLVRVAKPTGAIALTIWPSHLSTMNDLWNRVMSAVGTRPAAGKRLAPEVDFKRTPQGLKQLCQASGLEVDLATELSWTFSIDPRDLWLGVEGGIGTIGQTYLHSSPTEQLRLAEAYHELAATGEDGRLHLDSIAVLAMGHPDADTRPTSSSSRVH